MAAPCEDGARYDQEKSQRRTGKQDLPKVEGVAAELNDDFVEGH
jgi:hypothetical protein